MNADDFAPLFYVADNELMGGLPRDADLAATVCRLTGNLDAELGRRAPQVEPSAGRGRRIAARFLADADDSFTRNRPLLKVLAARYRLGIVSNFYGNLETVCRGAGLAPFFAVIVDSRRVGAEKPDPAIFRAALTPLGALPETTLFVGDSLRRDREGARRTGIDFIWIAPPAAQAAAARAAGGPPDQRTVASLSELAEILA